MALSRSMKNLMHDAAQARRGGGNPNPTGGGRSGFIGRAMQQARGRKPTRDPVTRGAGQQNLMKAKMQRLQQRGGMPRGGVMGGPAGGGIARPAVQPPPPGGYPSVKLGGAGKPRPGRGSFGFASRGGGGTPALQELTAGARSQVMGQRAARPTGLPGAISGAQQQAAMQRARGAAPRPAGAVPGGVAGAAGRARARAAGPAALAQPRGQTTAQRIGGRQGPPARRGGMARALGSGGSRRRMLR